MNNMGEHMSQEAHDELLEELNADLARENVGGVVFVSILMVIGVIGNLHVLVVYIMRIKPSNHRIFIIVLAAIDLTTCVIGMPFIIVDLRHPLTFTFTAACKTLRFLNYFVAASSCMLMVVIAAERHRKICVPFGRQMSRTAAKFLCLMVLCLACCMSWPAPVLYGHSSVYITEHNVTGIQCGNIDRLKDTKYMAFFNVGLVLIFIVVFVTLSVLYFLIWRVVMKHTPLVGKSTSHKDAPSTQTTDSQEKHTSKMSSASQSTEMTSNNKTNGVNAQQSSSDQTNTMNTSGDNTHDTEVNGVAVDTRTKTVAYGSASKTNKTVTQVTSKPSDKSLEAARRTTIIFTLIATLLFVSYVPHLTMKIVMFLNTSYVPSLPYVNRVIFKTFVWCFFINNMANPFVYGFYDKQFRKHVRILYRKLPSLLCKRRSK